MNQLTVSDFGTLVQVLAHAYLWNNLFFALGLILVKEPYFNEAGYDKQKETMEGNENSKKYNEMVLIKVLQVKQLLLLTL